MGRKCGRLHLECIWVKSGLSVVRDDLGPSPLFSIGSYVCKSLAGFDLVDTLLKKRGNRTRSPSLQVMGPVPKTCVLID